MTKAEGTSPEDSPDKEGDRRNPEAIANLAETAIGCQIAPGFTALRIFLNTTKTMDSEGQRDPEEAEASKDYKDK